MVTIDVVGLMKRPRFKRNQVKARGISNERDRERRMKKTAYQDLGGGTSGLRAILLTTLFGFSTLSNAATFRGPAEQPSKMTIFRNS